jgi:hypothetical protein
VPMQSHRNRAQGNGKFASNPSISAQFTTTVIGLKSEIPMTQTFLYATFRDLPIRTQL